MTSIEMLAVSPYTDRILAAVQRKDCAGPLYQILQDYARAVAEHNVAARDAQIAQLEKANEQLHAHGERMHEQLQKMRAAQQPPAEAVGTVLGGEFHYLRVNHGLPDGTKLYTPPPSAPVGVEGLVETWEKRAGELNDEGLYGCCAETYEQCAAQVRALAQQPAAVDGAMVARFLEAYRDTPGDEAIDADEKVARRWLTAALAAQPGGSDNG